MPDAGGGAGAGTAGVVTKPSARSVRDTVARFVELLESKGVKVFAVIDQQAEAGAVGLELRETTLVIFGNPAAGTAVMVAAPLSALDLPLKVLIWAEPGQGTRVSYTDPDTVAARYGLSRRVRRPAPGRPHADRRARVGLTGSNRGPRQRDPQRRRPDHSKVVPASGLSRPPVRRCRGGRRAWPRT